MSKSRAGASDFLVDAISEWLADEALSVTETPTLFEDLCWRLHAAGVPLLRAHASFTVLHPLYETNAVSWTASGVRVEHFRPEQRNDEPFQRSPIKHMLEHRLPILRRR